MKHRFRRGWLTGDECIELTETSVKLFKGKGPARREVPLKDIREIHGFSNMLAYDENGESFPTHMCRLVPRKGLSISICSSYWLRMGSQNRQIADDRSTSYLKFCHEIQRRVAAANPDAVLVQGNWGASIMGGLLSLICLGLVALLLGGAFFSGKPLTDAWPVLLPGGLFAVWGIRAGIMLARSYVPERTALSKVVDRRQAAAASAN